MPLIVGIRFKPTTKIYYFDPTGFEDLQVGDRVVVETARGRELGVVAVSTREVPPEQVVGQLKRILRKATSIDLADAQHYASQEEEALLKCREKVAEFGLPIKVIRAEYNFDGSHLSFFFTAEQRVDFRALVRDLARVFRARIELRQIGVRDEAKLIHGVGGCGRPLCCATHLCEFIPVSIKMAKLQGLPLSPMEISGVCGRLLCCLTYENAIYQEAQHKLPRLGTVLKTPHGLARVTGYNVLKETVEVQSESGGSVEMPLAELQLLQGRSQDAVDGETRRPPEDSHREDPGADAEGHEGLGSSTD